MTASAEAKVKFSEHVFMRYVERMNGIHGSRIDEEAGWIDVPKLRDEILRKGVFFEDAKSKKPNGFYCIVSNLTVYRGCVNPNGSLYITTTYPYSKQLRGLLVKLPKLEIPTVQQHRTDLEARLGIKLYDKR